MHIIGVKLYSAIDNVEFIPKTMKSSVFPSENHWTKIDNRRSKLGSDVRYEFKKNLLNQSYVRNNYFKTIRKNLDDGINISRYLNISTEIWKLQNNGISLFQIPTQKFVYVVRFRGDGYESARGIENNFSI